MKRKMLAGLACSTIFIALLTACNSNTPREVTCSPPSGHNLDQAISAVKSDLKRGCQGHFDSYLWQLLEIARGDPGKSNKAKFSEFLLWANSEGLLSKRQAREIYNRYFGIKFVSMLGEYSVCSEACPRQPELLSEMKTELADKETGLLKVSGDRPAYRRAHQLYSETELVLEATCTACGSSQP
ncbi:MAG: hypothetical protein GY703_15710 [Gammaproteobacteria bacterium]|nr:hypothetical protein [Gammaproteobacteria bacterium]